MKNTKNTSNTPDLFLGIDVGKTDLYCHIIGNDQTNSYQFDNSKTGIEDLITWLQKLALR